MGDRVYDAEAVEKIMAKARNRMRSIINDARQFREAVVERLNTITDRTLRNSVGKRRKF